jgi:glycosyltransferase involved in cell wall biosynthesis
MHILISALHRPSKPTGVCRHAANLAQALADSQRVSKVTLIIGAWQTDYFKKAFNLASEKVQIISVDIKNNSITRNTWFLVGLPKLANKLKPDIIHMSFPFPFLRIFFSCPIVTTIHDLYPYECPENFGSQVIFNRYFLKQAIINSDGISCVSETTREKLKLYFSKILLTKKNTAIYNHVDFSQVQPQRPDNIGMESSPSNSFLLSVAQHRKNKNLDILIQSYSLLIKQGDLEPSTKLIIVGSSGPETENLYEQINKLSLQRNVLMVSSISDEQLSWLYQNCQLFVIPSSTEGFCLPVVEALYLNCKVVCSDIPIFQEICLSNCTYFHLQDEPIVNLSKAIVDALKVEYHNQFDGFRFSKSSVVEQYLNFYSSVNSMNYASK